MAYIKPAVQVYQDLVNAGGAQALNPDMPACIVGPLNTVIVADLTDPVSVTESIGNHQNADGDWIDAKITDTSAETKVFVNRASAKPGQVIDSNSYDVVVQNAVVRNYLFQPTTALSGDTSTQLNTNQIGDVTAIHSTRLPYATGTNHVSLGDTVATYATFPDNESIPTDSTYITRIDETTTPATIHFNKALTVLTTEYIVISHKFSTLTAAEFNQTNGADPDPVEPYIAVGFTNILSPYLYGTIIGDGYTMHPEAEAEVDGVDSMNIFIGYRAQRADLAGRVLTISDITDLEDQLGEISSANPLAYGVSLALANSGGTAIHAIALDPGFSERDGHTQATELAQAQRIHQMVPLTTELSIHGTYKAHVNAMSLPESGNWRVAMTNCALPDEDYLFGQPGSADGDDADIYPDLLEIGTLNSTVVELPRGGSAPNLEAGDYLVAIVLDDSDPENITSSYVYSDTIDTNSGSTITLTSANWTDVNGAAGIPPVADADGFIHFYGARAATKQGQAEWVAAQASTWIDKRMWMFPGNVLVPDANGLDEELPGYYLMAALAGFISGTPPQQPITNIAIAGISDLVNGNFYFTEAQLNIMAEFGTLLYAQNAQGTTPYCRHGLTTDVSVLEYREVLKVKNWDYLSYYYKDILDPFIGTWNITPDTLQTIRQTTISASESLLTRKLPKIGAPLLSYSIDTLEQSATSADSIELIMSIAIVNPNNYTNVHLQI